MREAPGSIPGISTFCTLFLRSADTTRVHYSYTTTLGLRTFFVVTKADACAREDLHRTVSELKEMIIDNRGVPFEVEREQHVTKAAESFAQNRYVNKLVCKSVSLCLNLPVFSVCMQSRPHSDGLQRDRVQSQPRQEVS